MSKTIEELEKERDEILAKVEELDRLTRDLEAIEWPEVGRVLEELKAFRPKRKPREVWARYRNGNLVNVYGTKAQADQCAFDCETVHMREVRPLPELPELPEMEEWTAYDGLGTIKEGDKDIFLYRNLSSLTERHNATVRAFKAWAEHAKKEVGDE